MCIRDRPRVQTKSAELEEVLRSAAGLWVEALADRQRVAPGDRLTVTAALLARGGVPLVLESLTLEAVTPRGVAVLERRGQSQTLPDNTARKEPFTFTLPADTPLAQPAWLDGPGAEAWTILPEAPAPFRLRARLALPEGAFEVTVPVQFRFRDPVLGERTQPLLSLIHISEPTRPY